MSLRCRLPRLLASNRHAKGDVIPEDFTSQTDRGFNTLPWNSKETLVSEGGEM